MACNGLDKLYKEMPTINISEAKSTLSSLIAQVEKGRKIIIGKAGKPVAALVLYRPDTTPRKLGGTWSGKVNMADDFDILPSALADAFDVTPRDGFGAGYSHPHLGA